MLHDTCPNCGYRRKPYLLSTDSDAPGLIGLWKGEGDPQMQMIAKIGTIVISALIIVGIMTALHIHL